MSAQNRVMVPGNDIRASDEDRDRAAARLRQHYAEGRLDEAELTERLDGVYRARTCGELQQNFLDLPTPTEPSGREVTVPRHDRPARARGRRATHWGAWASASLVSWAIWGATVATSGGHSLEGLWPIWVTVPWGAVLLAQDPPWGHVSR